MEWADEVLVLGILLRALKTGRQLHDLVVVRGEHNAIISSGQGQTHDSARHDA